MAARSRERCRASGAGARRRGCRSRGGRVSRTKRPAGPGLAGEARGREPGHQRAPAEPGWRGPEAGQVRPLPRGRDPAMRPDLVNGHCERPARDEPGAARGRRLGRVGTAPSWRIELASRLAEPHPAPADRRLTGVLPDGGAGRHGDPRGPASGPRAGHPLPAGGRIEQTLRPARLALPVDPWSPPGPGFAPWCRVGAGGLQPPAGDPRHRRRQSGGGGQPLPDGVGAVRHADQGALGPPAAPVAAHRPPPVGPPLVAAAPLRAIALRGGQDGQDRHPPEPPGPRQLGHHRQRAPAPPAGLDQGARTRAHRIAGAPLGRALGPAPTLERLIQPDHARPSDRHDHPAPQPEPAPTPRPARPARPIAHPRVVLGLPLAAQSHPPQPRRDRPLARRQDPPAHQPRDPLPHALAEDVLEHPQQAYNGAGQGSPGSALQGSPGSALLAGGCESPVPCPPRSVYAMDQA
jgi:hypothetical protein